MNGQTLIRTSLRPVRLNLKLRISVQTPFFDIAIQSWTQRQHVQPFSTIEYSEPKVSPQDKIFIAMSSGVDSSVAAALLLRSEHPRENLLPFYMANWSPSAGPGPIPPPPQSNRAPRNPTSTRPQSSKGSLKCTEREYSDVKDVCRALGLSEPTYMNFEKEYWCEVFAPMLEMYRCGKTPNPDVECNRHIKFGAVMKKLKDEFHKRSQRMTEKESKWWLATGHYAHILYHNATNVPHLLRSADLNKDQTFYLSTLNQDVLSRLLFPLGSHKLSKPAVKSLARELLLPGWRLGETERPESMGLCFVEPAGGKGQTGFRRFLSEYLEPEPGDVIIGPSKKYPRETESIGPNALEGTVVGKHAGLWHATIGEKARFELPQGSPEYQGRWYISKKNTELNTLEIVRGQDNARLYGKGMIVEKWRWLGDDAADIVREQSTSDEGGLVAQFRHRQTPLKVFDVEISGGSGVQSHLEENEPPELKIIFDSPAMAIAPGQSAALWFGDRCLGGGVIRDAIELD
ncbi:5-methylaminomethyl-2-thiouridylate-methyltransferase [Choiromyces venosus 120613-1]|uniref:tRNA-5-taurinomethyluridine 2-sulfurtransferase n=1 Tax=Choiromyces venosus 120613-1 TaxID=1336337 RepID=A0A3N4JJI1_9PEZI|nr:5-methylaminomethyl-2-thiouridylate-methyltransferase [Choiromyces venosus 120613-1]